MEARDGKPMKRDTENRIAARVAAKTATPVLLPAVEVAEFGARLAALAVQAAEWSALYPEEMRWVQASLEELEARTREVL